MSIWLILFGVMMLGGIVFFFIWWNSAEEEDEGLTVGVHVQGAVFQRRLSRSNVTMSPRPCGHSSRVLPSRAVAVALPK